MLTGSSGTRLLYGRRRDRVVRFYELSLVVFVYVLVPPFWEHLRILVRHSCYSYA